MYLRQSTSQVIRFGPCLDKADGVTEETTLTLAQADMRLSKDGGAFAQKSAAGNATHDSDGWYSTTLSTTDTATVGELILNVHQPANMLPVWVRWWVLEEAVYDDLYGAAAPGYLKPTTATRTLDVAATGEAGIDLGNTTGALTNSEVGWIDGNDRVDVGQWLGTAVTTSATSNKPEVDMNSISDDAAAANNLELAMENGAAGYVASDMKYLDGGAQSAADLKDFADAGYDPGTNKVEGVKTADVTTANTDMVGTDNAALASALTTHDNKLAPVALDGGGATIGGMLTKLADDNGGADFDATTDSQQAIRDRGDAAWTTGGGGSDRLLMVDTTIATLASQTSFTLTAGSADDDAYVNCTIVVEDVSTATQKAVGLISAYTGGTKTVTLKYDPGVFTMAVTDKVYILAENSLKSTAQNRQLDVTATGAAGIDWANVENPTTAVDLSATDIQLVDTVTTNSDMRGTDSAALASVCTEARLGTLATLAAETRDANMLDQFKRTLAVIESQRGQHTYQPMGNIFFVDPVNGNTHASGNRGGITDPYATIQDCHDNAVTDSNHDLIILLAGAAGGVTTHTIAATTTISKRYVFLRGPGRDFIITRTGSGNTIDITADGIEISGVQVGTAAVGAGDGINITGADFHRVHNCWFLDTQGDGIHVLRGSNCRFHDNNFHGTGVGGTGQGIHIVGTAGSSDDNAIYNNHFAETAGDSILIEQGTTNDTEIHHNTIHDSAAWGINIGASSVDAQVHDNILGNNASGNINDGGTTTILANNEQWAKAGSTRDDLDDDFTATQKDSIADAVADEVLTGATHNVSNSLGRRIRELDDQIGYEGGAIWLDTVNGAAGQVVGENGTVGNPSSNITDTLALAVATGRTRIRVASGSTVTLLAALDGYEIYNSNWTLVLNGQSISGSCITGADVSGVCTGANAPDFVDCHFTNATLPPYHAKRCGFGGTITAGSAGDFFFDNCHSSVAGTSAPVFDFGAGLGASNVNYRSYSGGVEIQNMGAGAGSYNMSLEGNGQLIINANCSATSTIAIRGNFTVTDNAGGAVTLSDEARFDVTQITGGAYGLDTDANGRIRIVDGTGAGELDTDSGTVLLRSATETQIDNIETLITALNDPTAQAIVDQLMAEVIESAKTYKELILDYWAITVGDALADNATTPTSITYDSPDGSVQRTHAITPTTRTQS